MNSDSPDCDLCRRIAPGLYCFEKLLLIPFMISSFVNGRSRDVIMTEMRQRIDRGNQEKEVEETIQVSL